MSDPCVGESSAKVFSEVGALTALSLCLRATPGAYALLLGSGVSRAASVPTGWQILLELIRWVAHLEGHDPGPKPDKWYQQKFDSPPDYSKLLARLGATPAERSQIIRDFIEPADQERDLGIKVPTEAHRAITELVGEGYVKVIVTTNFDRLIETALAEPGIVPTVITPDDPEGNWLPLVHNRCTLVKLHGDYIDTTILNTAGELVRYKPKVVRMLRQIIREYGLIISGWSGEWDIALVRAVSETKGSQFSTYWIAHSEPKEHAQRVIEARNARVVTQMDAETFFPQLAENVRVLEDLTKPELLSVQMAQAAMQRYIDEPTRRIRLRALVMAEANRVRAAILDQSPESFTEPITRESLDARVKRYAKLTAVLRALLATGCYWGEDQHHGHWIACIERVASLPLRNPDRFQDWADLRYFPALIAMYAAGIAALANEQYDTLAAVLVKARVKVNNTGPEVPLVVAVDQALLQPDSGSLLYGANDHRRRVPLSTFLWENAELWTAIREHVPDDDRFRACFDRFEYLTGIIRVDQRKTIEFPDWSPPGHFALWQRDNRAEKLMDELDTEIQQEGGRRLLQAGLFDGSDQRLRDAKRKYDVAIRRFQSVL